MKTIKIEITHNGSQTRAYGPDAYEAIIELEPTTPFKSDEHGEERALHYFKRVVCDYYTPNTQPHWHVFTLTEVKKVGDNRWLVRAERPYDD